jgi:hypothetical protein
MTSTLIADPVQYGIDLSVLRAVRVAFKLELKYGITILPTVFRSTV